MKQVGVRRLLGPNACGALRADLELGEFVVCDQFVDRTSGRPDTFYDGPVTTHVSAADPYCPSLRALLVETGRGLGLDVRDGGTMRETTGRGMGGRLAPTRRVGSGVRKYRAGTLSTPAAPTGRDSPAVPCRA